MKKLFKFLAFGMMALAIAISSCSKDEAVGDIGPIGPQGEQGIQGPEGPQGPAGQDGEAQGVPGPQGEHGPTGADGATGPAGSAGPQGETGPRGASGTDGEDGNANVIASDWFGPDGQTFVTNGYTRYAEFDKNITGLDTELYKNGTLLVYAKFSSFVPEVWPAGHSGLLPLNISGGTTDHIFTNYFSPTNLKIRYRREGPGDTWIFPTSSRFRYIAIPSNISGKTSTDFSKMSYDEVIQHFGLNH